MSDPAAFIASWFTPSTLFIFVNIAIGTIAITSRFTSSSSPSKNQIHETTPQLTRSPSLLQRLGSFNLAFYKHQPTPTETHYAPPESETQLVRTPSLLERVRSFSNSIYKDDQTESSQPEPENSSADPKEPSLLERVRSINLSRLCRLDSQEDEIPNEKSRKEEMRKSASERAVSMMCESEEEDEETVEQRRPATASASCREDEEVDTKADDFINKFKKQLRLQRLESLLRYRDTNAIRR